ncbi:hypothetical protein TNCV_1499651 [Trichonephila clavipes]|nr:hypothetical protein TNCV_1499651 [Trichonephila clavipes]
MHNENCKANHFGNSGSMEVSGAIKFFQCSESLHSLRYIEFLGDGDAITQKQLTRCSRMEIQAEETDQAIEEPDEIMHINRDSESKYEKSDRHETFELN